MKWHINLMVVCLILQVVNRDFGQHALWDRIEEYEKHLKIGYKDEMRIEGEGISIGRKSRVACQTGYLTNKLN